MEPDEAPLVAAKDKVIGKIKEADPDAHQIPLIAENVGENSAYTSPDGFYSKPLWQRALVILAGPVMSFVLGYAVFCLMGVTTGIPTGKTLNKVALAGPDGEGKRIGLQIGDRITSINGMTITDGQEMINLIHGSPNKPITITVQRGSLQFTRTATPRPNTDDQNKPLIYVDVVVPGSLSALGALPGDTLAQINGTDIQSIQLAQSLLRSNSGKPVTAIVSREGQDGPVTLTGTLPEAVSASKFNAHEIGLLNIIPAKEIKRVGLSDSIAYGNQTVILTFQSLANLIHHRELHKAAGGIIFMYQATGLAVKSGLPDIVSMLASLSISLAIFNLLPIPVLDGGHLLTFFIEWIGAANG